MNSRRTGPTPSTAQALLTLRIIGASLAVGVTAFAAVAWVAPPAGLPGAGAAPADPTVMLALVLALALGAASAAMILWRARVAPQLDARGAGADPAARLGRIQTNLIIVWAVVEGAALFGVAVHYLFDVPLAAAVGVILIWGALAATWPKREWLEPRR